MGDETVAVHEKGQTSWRSRLGIRWRLGIFVTIAIAIVLGSAVYALDRAYNDYSREEIHDRSAALLQSFALPCAIAVAVDNLEGLDTYLAELAAAGEEHLSILHVGMVGYRGQVLAEAYGPHSSPEAIEPSGKETLQAFYLEAAIVPQPMWRRFVSQEGKPTLLVSMPAVSGLRWGTLIAHFDLSAHEEQRSTVRAVLVGTSVVIALTVLGILIVGLWRIVVRPVRVLAWAASQVREGNLGSRAIVASEDELGQLARTFNAMAEELQDYTQGLEGKVVERTRELHEKNRELEKANIRLDKLARTDPLTGVFNRGHFVETIEAECLRSDRTESPFSVILADVDHFKQFNDRFGHQAGDWVLQEVVRILGEGIRSTDVLARYGGEEFVMLLVDTDVDAAVPVAEALCKTVASASFTDQHGTNLGTVTISMGVASYPAHSDDRGDLLRCADQALYKAKSDGRNRVERWNENSEKQRKLT